MKDRFGADGKRVRQLIGLLAEAKGQKQKALDLYDGILKLDETNTVSLFLSLHNVLTVLSHILFLHDL